MTDCVKIDTGTPTRSRSLVEREQKENAATGWPRGAHRSQEMCISIISQGREANSPTLVRILSGGRPRQASSRKMGNFSKSRLKMGLSAATDGILIWRVAGRTRR